MEKGEPFPKVQWRERLRGQKAQESRRPRPELNPRERREARLTGRDEAAQAPAPGRMGLVRKCESGEETRKLVFDLSVGEKL